MLTKTCPEFRCENFVCRFLEIYDVYVVKGKHSNYCMRFIQIKNKTAQLAKH